MAAHAERHGRTTGILRGLGGKLADCGGRVVEESVKCFADLVPNWQAALDLWGGSEEALRGAEAEILVNHYSTLLQNFEGAARQASSAWPDGAGWDGPYPLETLLAAAEAGTRSVASFCRGVLGGPLRGVVLQAQECPAGAESGRTATGEGCLPRPADPTAYNEVLEAVKPVRFFLESCWTAAPPEEREALASAFGDVFRRAGRWRLVPWQMPAEYYHPGLEAKPLWSLEELPAPLQREVRLVEKNAKLLRSVGLKLLGAGRFRNAELSLNLGPPGAFKELPAWKAGDSAACVSKKLCQLLDRTPAARFFLHGLPKFSLVSGGAVVPPHFGSTNLRLRVHVPLDVPEDPAPWLAIRDPEGVLVNHTSFWSETRIFDDSFEHQVGYSGGGSRLIFIFDLPHPDLLSGRAGRLRGLNSAAASDGLELLLPLFAEGFEGRLEL